MREFILKQPGPLAVLWAAFIFLLCATPGQYIPSASWLDLLSVDKLVHAGVFAVLTALSTTYAAQQKSSRLAILLVLASIAYGLFLELMQAKWFSNRSADWMDAVANAIGCLLGWWWIRRRLQRKAQGL